MTQVQSWRLLFLALAAVILYLALGPLEAMPTVATWDKTNHVLAFATLAVIGTHAFSERLAWLYVGLLAFGGAIEVLQSLTPNRSAEWLDVLADAIGLAIGALIVRLVKSRVSSGRS